MVYYNVVSMVGSVHSSYGCATCNRCSSVRPPVFRFFSFSSSVALAAVRVINIKVKRY